MKIAVKILFTIVLVFMLSVITYGQQQVMFTQYMFNNLAINPAYAGNHDAISATLLIREQWIGIKGAPSTQTLSLHSPIRNQRVALGALILNDRIGVTNQTGAYFSYAYRIPVKNQGKLSFGLQGGFTHYSANYSSVSATDPTYQIGDISEYHPNIGFGIFYSTDRLYVGLSAPQLIETRFDKGNPESQAKFIRHYFTEAGYVFDLGPSYKLKPNILIKTVEGAPIEIDLNLNLLIKEIMWFGLSWRSFDSFDAIIQLQASMQLQIGYAYDFLTTTALGSVNAGSHELMLNYIFSQKKRIKSPRYF